MDQEDTTVFKVIIGVDWESFNWALMLTFLVILCFMIHRIRRFIKLKDKRVEAQKMSMVRVEIPFTVSLEICSQVVAAIFTTVKCKVEIYWRVNIAEFQKEIEAKWTDNMVLTNSCHGTRISAVLEKGEGRYVIDNRIYYSAVRSKRDYPAAIIVRTFNKSTSPRDAEGLITTVHLGESATAARIVTQSLKLVSGQLTLLQRLFPSGLYKDGPTDICAVCVEKPVTRVILPCKHACLCRYCFERVIICPMCRAGIQSFFIISPELETKNDLWYRKLQSFVKTSWLRL